MDAMELAAVAAVVSALLSLAAYKMKALTADGAAASFAIGSAVGIFGSLNAFALLTVFTFAGFAATASKLSEKKKAGLQEGRNGERTWKNVLGVGLPPCIVVFVNFLYPLEPAVFYTAFISTMAVAGADTIASEIGIRDRNVYLITNFRKVPPGTNGGVSVFGTLVSSAASLAIALLGWLIMTFHLSFMALIPFAAGVVGNLLDSVFGVLLEDRGIISKYTNNCSTALIGAAVGAGICVSV